MGRSQVILLDTCALLWRSFEPECLSSSAGQAIADSTEIIISTISIWEVGVKTKKGRLKIPLSIDSFVARLRQLAGLRMIAVDEGIWLESLKLDWRHRDPADRVIVATAKTFGCPIVTNDRTIKDFYTKTIS